MSSNSAEFPNSNRNSAVISDQTVATQTANGSFGSHSNTSITDRGDTHIVAEAVIDKEREALEKREKKRTEVRSVIVNLYILFKHTNVGWLAINYLKPIKTTTSATAATSGSYSATGGSAPTVQTKTAIPPINTAGDLSLANPPPTRRSWYSASFVIVLILVEMGLSGAYAWAYNHTSDHIGDVLYAITEDNKDAFNAGAQKIIIAAIIGAASNALYLAIGDYLCFDRFQQALTYELLVRYMSDHTHFYLIHLGRDITDPSTRISSDVEQLCEKLKLIVFGTPMYTGYITTTATVVWFSYTLITEYGWFLMLGSLIFFVASVVVTGLLSIFPSRMMKAQKEASSAFSSMQHYFSAHSEHVAFLRGESAEFSSMVASSKKITATSRITTIVGLPLNFSTIMFYWGVTFFSVLIPGWGYWWLGAKTLKGYDNLSNASYCVQALMNTMTTYILLAQEYSEMSAVLQRVTELVLAMKYIEEEYVQKRVSTTAGEGEEEFGGGEASGNGDRSSQLGQKLQRPGHHRKAEAGGYYRIRTVERPPFSTLEVRDVTLFRPNTQNSEPLIEDLSFSVGSGKDQGSLLIMGPSGVGKSSLLRVIAGLWPAMTTDPIKGGIFHPPVQRQGRGGGGMMFLPQRPYLIEESSLAAQIMYPMTAAEVIEEAMRAMNYGGRRRADSGANHDSSSSETFGVKMQSTSTMGKNSGETKRLSDRGPLLQKLRSEAAAIEASDLGPLATEEVIHTLKKEIFGLLVKVRLGHVARRYAEADWFGVVRPLDESSGAGGVTLESPHSTDLRISHAATLQSIWPPAPITAGPAHENSNSNAATSSSPLPSSTRLATVDMSSCEVPWNSLLSVGEQQRLAIARVLFHKPSIAIVDEATSAMDEDSEVMCLQAVHELGIRMLSVAHRSTVKQFHDRLLLIQVEGGGEDDPTNTNAREPELPPPVPLINSVKPKISYTITDIPKKLQENN